MSAKNILSRYENDPFLKDSYFLDPDSGRLIVEVLLEKQIYLFNEWDNSTYRRKDIDPDLIFFLEECFDEIPFEYEIQLNIAINEKERNSSLESDMAEGIKAQFRHYMRASKRKLMELYRRATFYVIISAVFLITAALFERLTADMPVYSAVLQGLYIGGWVFLWEAISEISFSRGRSALTHKIRAYERFLRAPVVFTSIAQKK